MAVLKLSTAYTRMFLMVESADHITGLTGASPTVDISKAGGSFGAAGGAVTEVANGWYKVALTTTDTGTLGELAYHITAASGDPTDFVDQVCGNILGDTLPASLSSSERNSVADAILDRDMSTGADSGSTTVRTPRQALRALRNKVDLSSGSSVTVYKEDDSTSSWTAALTTNGSALPIVTVDPAGP
jgi:hypothetical protein